MGNIGVELSKEELADQLMRAIETINDLRVEVERLQKLVPPVTDRAEGGVSQGTWSVFAEQVVEERDSWKAKAERNQELYESALQVVQRLQDEREGLLRRVERALLGIEENETEAQQLELRPGDTSKLVIDTMAPASMKQGDKVWYQGHEFLVQTIYTSEAGIRCAILTSDLGARIGVMADHLKSTRRRP